ncbi:MAG: hypothetical protein QOJ42_2537, partial [Acidobacteriaceae bacterium]|nr:hypothetical protein [Acidobacteriaceae bacterium]
PANDAPADRILDRNQSAPAAPLIAHALNRVPLAEDNGFHALLDTRQPFSIQKGPFNRRR